MNFRAIECQPDQLDPNLRKQLASDLDLESRKQLTQMILDRMIDRKFGKEYVGDLIQLNSKYSFEYKVVNGVRVYNFANKIGFKIECPDSTEKGEITIGENTSISFNHLIKPAVPQEQDVFFRAQCVQDCLDRILNKDYGTAYLSELLNLNNRYSS